MAERPTVPVDPEEKDEAHVRRDLADLHVKRAEILKSIGVDDAATVEWRLQRYVDACVVDLEAAIENIRLPDADGPTNESHNALAVKSPSGNFGDIERELQEFRLWFLDDDRVKGSDRKPRLREELSADALNLMLGEAPFGRSLLIGSKLSFPLRAAKSPDMAIGNGPPMRRGPACIDATSVARMELLSENEAIRARQFAAFMTTRGPAGEPLAMRPVWIAMEEVWPEPFLDLVVGYRVSSGEAGAHLPIELLQRHFSELDRQGMVNGLDIALLALPLWRASEDPRNKATISRWSQSEPIFTLMFRVLTEVWPVNRSLKVPRGQIDELAGNIVLWVQNLVNLQKGSRLYSAYAKYRTVLGGQAVSSRKRDDKGRKQERKSWKAIEDELVERVLSVVRLIVQLRIEEVAYYWGRHTIASILRALDSSRDTQLQRRVYGVSALVLPDLDKRLELRRRLLKFGSDKPQGNLMKWFGNEFIAKRKKSGNERAIADLVFPSVGSKERWLRELDITVASLKLNAPGTEAWRALVEWASGPGLATWSVDPINSETFIHGIEFDILHGVNRALEA